MRIDIECRDKHFCQEMGCVLLATILLVMPSHTTCIFPELQVRPCMQDDFFLVDTHRDYKW